MTPPPLIVPDTMALIQLAAVRRLDLLPRAGQAVLVDMVEHEAMRRTDKPFAHDVAIWTNMRSMVGGDREPVFADTAVYLDYRQKRDLNPAYSVRGAGELAIAEWVGANASSGMQGVLIVSSDKKMPARLRQAAPNAPATILSTEKFLGLTEQLGLISDADATWRRLLQATANPPARKLLGQTP